jgi:hypothetical protein
VAREQNGITFRRQRRAITAVARFIAGIAGSVLCGSFVLSVLRDPADIARVAWTEGADLLGAYGGAGLIMLPFIGVFTAYLRRGRRELVTELQATPMGLTVRLASGRTQEIPRTEISGGHQEHLEKHRRRVTFTLNRGLDTGDQIELEGPEVDLLPLSSTLDAVPTEISLSRSGLGIGAAIALVSATLGGYLSSFAFSLVEARAISIRVADAQTADAWSLALFVACSSLVALSLSLLTSARKLRIGLDGVVVDTPVREHFIPAAELRATTFSSLGLRIGRKQGLSFIVPAPGCSLETLAAAAQSVEQLRKEATLRTEGPQLNSLVGRWREALYSGALGPKGYRERALQTSDLSVAMREPSLSLDAKLNSARLMLATEGEPARIEIRRLAAKMVLSQNRDLLLEVACEEAIEDDGPETQDNYLENQRQL